MGHGSVVASSLGKSIVASLLTCMMLLALLPPEVLAQEASTKAKKKAEVLDLLLKKEPPAEARLRAVGPDVDSVLADVINDQDVDMLSRQRAITAIGLFDNKRASQVLMGIITDPAWEKPYRVRALEAAARVMGEEALDLVKDRVTDPDAEVRAACVRALETMGGARALGLLKNMQFQERNADVLRAIDKAIAALARSGPELR